MVTAALHGTVNNNYEKEKKHEENKENDGSCTGSKYGAGQLCRSICG